jgi:penicillin-binding protein 2
MFSNPEARSLGAEGRRLAILAFLAGAVYAGMAARLFHLQIIQGADMFRLAEQNRTQIIPLSAPRGRILDRKEEVLLDNAPRFSLFYSNLSVTKDDTQRVQQELSAFLPEKAELLRRRLSEARQSGKMTRLVAGLPREKALGLIERRVILPGVQVVVEPQRWARAGALASHLIGYVDEVTPQDLKRQDDDRLKAGQFIGRMGVERMYDRLLRGQDGGLQFEMDARGRHLHVMNRIAALPGNDVHLTMDKGLQSAAERGLDQTATRRGAVVAVDPRTGAILALVSHPVFDPSGDLGPYLADKTLPLFNRALQGTYPLGSVFKAATALAALKKGWNIRRTILCTGVFKFGDREFKCWKKHGLMDFMDAMAWSCDTYYYTMGLDVGLEGITAVGRGLGLGERTGIDLSPESPGLLPGREWKQRTQKFPWVDGDTVNLSIGQGFLLVTPIQAAMFMAAVANGGNLWVPRVVDRVTAPDGRVLYRSAPRLRSRLDLPPAAWATVDNALREVVKRGTGGQAFRPDISIGGKTGTAQNPHGEDHAWFAAFAGPIGEEPTIVVVGFVENGGHGSDAALPVVREVLLEAFPPPPPPVRIRPRIIPPPAPIVPVPTPEATLQ